ncbi:MAG TPA: hypothetical protein VEQ17_07590 [Steroidobacteraceae bacterium]|nr:hypothetical protein [Steroidobacteraceae bacterium]
MAMQKIVAGVILFVGLTGSGWAAAADNCPSTDSLKIICGADAVEDLERVGSTKWLVGSGLAESGGHLLLIDTAAKRLESIYPVGQTKPAHDARRFPDCRDEPDPKKFSAHGISLRDAGGGRQELMVINHGGREAIEFFAVTMPGGKPAVQWLGCVIMPPDTSVNSVAPMPDGGFVTTLFNVPSKGGINAVFNREVTGGLLRWTPGGKVTAIPGTEVSGANGVLVSQQGRVIHMAAWGTRELVRFEWKDGKLSKRTVPLGFAGDNLRWSQDGRSILVGGQKFEPRPGGPAALDGWSVVRVDPDTLAVKMVRDAGPKEVMQGITVGVEVGNDIWVGQFRGNQVGYFAIPK